MNLRTWRTKRGFTQKALAERIGVGQATIADLETGNGNPTFALIRKITDATFDAGRDRPLVTAADLFTVWLKAQNEEEARGKAAA